MRVEVAEQFDRLRKQFGSLQLPALFEGSSDQIGNELLGSELGRPVLYIPHEADNLQGVELWAHRIERVDEVWIDVPGHRQENIGVFTELLSDSLHHRVRWGRDLAVLDVREIRPGDADTLGEILNAYIREPLLPDLPDMRSEELVVLSVSLGLSHSKLPASLTFWPNINIMIEWRESVKGEHTAY